MTSGIKALAVAVALAAASASGVMARDWGSMPQESLPRTHLARSRLPQTALMTTPDAMTSPRSHRRVRRVDGSIAAPPDESNGLYPAAASEPSLRDHILPGAVLRYVETAPAMNAKSPASPSATH